MHQTLAAQIREVYASAEHSERAALEMTADVRRLDTAKRNLTTTISMFKRLQMLGGYCHLICDQCAYFYADTMIGGKRLLRAN